MNVLASALLVGIRRTKRTEGLIKISFFSNKERKQKEGVFRGMFSGEKFCIVQYKNENGKTRLAVVNRISKTAVEEQLVYVNRCKKGSAIACQCIGNKMHVILLNERGETILNLGQRSKLMNRPFYREGVGEATTNREVIRKFMEI